MNLNKIQVTGRAGSDVETFADGKIAKLNLAINDGYYDKDNNWVDRTIWIKAVSTIPKISERFVLIKKGQTVYIDGKLSENKFINDQGVDKSKMEISVMSFQIVNLVKKDESASTHPAPATSIPSIEELEEDSDLPF